MRVLSKKTITPAQRIDRAIELLVHYNLTPIEIVYQLNFNSLEEFTNQFRNIVGLSPEQFKQFQSRNVLVHKA